MKKIVTHLYLRLNYILKLQETNYFIVKVYIKRNILFVLHNKNIIFKFLSSIAKHINIYRKFLTIAMILMNSSFLNYR